MLPVPAPRFSVPPVVVSATEPARLGDVVAPLPPSVAEDVTIVYAPAGRAWPFRTRSPVVSVIEALPVMVAVYDCQSPLAPRLDSAAP